MKLGSRARRHIEAMVPQLVAQLAAEGIRRERLVLCLHPTIAECVPEHWCGLPVVGRPELPPEMVRVEELPPR